MGNKYMYVEIVATTEDMASIVKDGKIVRWVFRNENKNTEKHPDMVGKNVAIWFREAMDKPIVKEEKVASKEDVWF